MRHVFLIAMLTMTLAAGCAKRPDDATIVTNIKSQMFSDEQLKNASLQVTSSNGEITLSGTAPNDAARLAAYKIAAQTPGAMKVNDQMTLLDAGTAAAQAQVPAAPESVPEGAAVRVHARTPSAAPIRKAHVRKTSAEPERTESANNMPIAAPQPAPEPAPQDPPPAAQAAAARPAPPQPVQIQVPAGTNVTIRMIDRVDSSVNSAGETFHASLDAPIVVGNDVVVSKGANVSLRLVSASSAGKLTGKSELHMELVKLEFRGQSYSLVSSTYTLSGDSRGKNTAEKVGGGAVLGAIIGAIAGGGKGAAIGAAAGGGAGGVYQGMTKGKQVRIPAETKLDFQLEQPVTITVMPRSTPPAE